MLKVVWRLRRWRCDASVRRAVLTQLLQKINTFGG
jgi:hypothetical protein